MNLKALASGASAILLAAALTNTTIGSSASAADPSADVAASSVSADDISPGALPDSSFGPEARAQAIASFQQSAASTAKSLNLAPDSSLRVKDVVKDASGVYHVRYTRTYQGLPVVGGDLVVHDAGRGTADVTWDKAGNFRSADTKPTISQAAAAQAAGAPSGKAELVIWAVGGGPRVAWRSVVPAADGLHRAVVSDARTGAGIVSYDLEQTADATGTGKTLYSGNVPIHTNSIAGGFELKDLTRGGHRVTTMNNTTTSESGTLTNATNTWGNNAESNALTVAADAQYGAAVTWDFYQSLGRNGIRNDGVGARSRVHYGSNYDNAFWNDACFCMSYGDGDDFDPLVPLDVAGHEMTHGVTSNSAGLHYFGESGGLNEATSDIIGTSVEFFAANATDPGDYYIGEKIASSFPGGALRRMDTPSLDGFSYDCYTPLMGQDDVHFTSGVANHFFYLLSEGSGSKTIGGRAHSSAVCAGPAVAGVGRANAAKIWYRALNVYMVAGSDYKDARDATIRAARDLFGGPNVNCQTVMKAWAAVKVPANTYGCGGLIDRTSGPNVVRNPGFELATNGALWTQSRAGLVGAFGFQRSGAKHAYLRGLGTAGTDMLSQTLTVPATNPKLVYYLLVDSSEFGTTIYDTFKVRIKHGATTTVVQSSSNAKWDVSYHRYVVDLSAYAGQSVTLQFVATEDSSVQSGFLIDDVSIAPR